MTESVSQGRSPGAVDLDGGVAPTAQRRGKSPEVGAQLVSFSVPERHEQRLENVYLDTFNLMQDDLPRVGDVEQPRTRPPPRRCAVVVTPEKSSTDEAVDGGNCCLIDLSGGVSDGAGMLGTGRDRPKRLELADP